MADAAKSQSAAQPALPTWPDEIYRVLKDAGVRQVAMVPDAGHSRLIRSFEADPETRVVTLTTEEEGVAMLAGAWLGGEFAGVVDDTPIPRPDAPARDIPRPAPTPTPPPRSPNNTSKKESSSKD